MALTEAHRVLLTYIRALKAVPVAEATRKFALLAERFALDAPELAEYISTINISLERFGFKIDTVRDQALDALTYVFVNTRFDDVIQGCTPYTPPELDAVKQLVDNIVNAHDFAFCVPYGNAKQHVAAVLKVRAADADYFLRRLIDDGWIELSLLGRVVLSQISLTELRLYLVDRFGVYSVDDSLGKLLRCTVCRELVTLGQRCGECPATFHTRCLAVYSRNNDKCACGDDLAVRPVGQH